MLLLQKAVLLVCLQRKIGQEEARKSQSTEDLAAAAAQLAKIQALLTESQMLIALRDSSLITAADEVDLILPLAMLV